ncbi:MAG: hypothetical protein RIS47_1439, partial [Bacteroidota bacterium]
MIPANAHNEAELAKYTEVALKADLRQLTSDQKEMLRIFFEVADLMDKVFQLEVMPNASQVFQTIPDSVTRALFAINYGPWNRLDNNKPFVEGVDEKPLGANFYPADMTKAEFDAWDNPEKKSPYTIIRRNDKRKLEAIPYHVAFAEYLQKASDLLRQAADLTDDLEFKKYLKLRAQALTDDQYFPSDIAWMEMKNNLIDFVVGPIETYEDGLYGYKTAHEAYILIKDMEWSRKLAHYATLLPSLQKSIPCDARFKKEVPGTDSDLNAYDVVYYKGDCNAGSKTIAINLPNDEKVQAQKGSRRLQLKNAMKAKFDLIMRPIAQTLLAPSQRNNVSFDAFFANTMFHEVAHGLGIRHTINGKGAVQTALKEQASALEEGKADVLGLFMVTQLIAKGEYQGDEIQNLTTFTAGIFRSIRFGGSSAHGKANLLTFNYFKENGAFARQDDGTYLIDYPKMKAAMNTFAALILKIQGEGDYAGIVQLMK